MKKENRLSNLKARKAIIKNLSSRGRLEKSNPSNLELYFILRRLNLANEIEQLTKSFVQRELRAAALRIDPVKGVRNEKSDK